MYVSMNINVAVTESVMRLVLECNEADGFLFPAVSFGDEEDEKISQNDLLLISKEKVIYYFYIDHCNPQLPPLLPVRLFSLSLNSFLLYLFCFLSFLFLYY